MRVVNVLCLLLKPSVERAWHNDIVMLHQCHTIIIFKESFHKTPPPPWIESVVLVTRKMTSPEVMKSKEEEEVLS